MNKKRLLALLVPAALLLVSALGSGCAINSLGRAPTDLDLVNDGDPATQADLARYYGVTFDHATFRRPGAKPSEVSEEVNLEVASASAPAWSDEAYNYLASSEAAAEWIEDPMVGFDQFAHNGTGQALLIGGGAGAGLVAGAVTWFIRTTVRDGISAEETTDAIVSTGGGLFAGLFLGGIMAAAFTYVMPAITVPLATPFYRKAARAYNQDLEERIIANGPQAALEDDGGAWDDGTGYEGDDMNDDGPVSPSGDAPPRPVEAPTENPGS
jgi:hypothetical protein